MAFKVIAFHEFLQGGLLKSRNTARAVKFPVAVKKRFRELTTVEGSRTGFELPDEIKEAEFLDLTRKPIAPSEQEVEENHRSVSAKLRGIERL